MSHLWEKKIELLEFAQVWMWNGCHYKKHVCVICLLLISMHLNHESWFCGFEHTMAVKDVSGSTKLPFFLRGHSVPQCQLTKSLEVLDFLCCVNTLLVVF